MRHSTLLWKNRSVLPKVAIGYYNALVLGKPVLRTVEFAITPHCNVNCSMCYATKIVDRKRTMMEVGDYADVWAQARKRRPERIVADPLDAGRRPRRTRQEQAERPVSCFRSPARPRAVAERPNSGSTAFRTGPQLSRRRAQTAMSRGKTCHASSSAVNLRRNSWYPSSISRLAVK